MLLTGALFIAIGLIADGKGEEISGPATSVLSSVESPDRLVGLNSATTGEDDATADPPEAAAAPAQEEAIVPGDAPAPLITGASAIVIEEPCGAVLHGVNEHTSMPPASLTKIVTALVAVDHMAMDRVLDVSIDGGQLSMATDSTVMGLVPGQRLTLQDLLGGLLMRSGNDAAITIADGVAGSQQAFAGMMNDKVAALGLHDSQFVNAHGLDATGHYTSAYDIAMLGRQLLRDPQLAQIVQSKSYTPNWDGGPLENINLLLGNYPGALGIKTGYTDLAGATIVGAAERFGRRLIVSVMHSTDLYVDTTALLDWAFYNTAPACGGPAQAQAAGTPAAQVAAPGP
jgi:D-alanyl-D-alanine carboxypeptidase